MRGAWSVWRGGARTGASARLNAGWRRSSAPGGGRGSSFCRVRALLSGEPGGADPITMAQDIDPFKLSSPRIFLVRMVVFLTLCVLLVIVLYKQIWTAFLANPGLNALIVAMIVIGAALALRQFTRLFPEIDWVNASRLAHPGLAVERPPVLLA